jgi:uncharacterized protein (DUF488 family)
MFILRVRYPMSGTIQEREYARLDEAIKAAHAHYASFPAGLALICRPQSEEMVMHHEELRSLYSQAAAKPAAAMR